MSEELKETTKQFDFVDKKGMTVGVVPLMGSLAAVVHRADGRPDEDLGVICRQKVSTAFVQVLCRAMDGGGYATEYGYIKEYAYHEWGTSATAEANTQNKCLTHVDNFTENAEGGLLVPGTQVGGSASYVTVATLKATGSVTITEHVVHPTAACGLTPFSSVDSYGLDRSVFTGIALSSGDEITFTYTLNVPAEA